MVSKCDVHGALIKNAIVKSPVHVSKDATEHKYPQLLQNQLVCCSECGEVPSYIGESDPLMPAYGCLVTSMHLHFSHIHKMLQV